MPIVRTIRLDGGLGKKQTLWEMWGFCKRGHRIPKSHPILHMELEPRDTDYLSLGFPEISYHSRRAWFSGDGTSEQNIGILVPAGNTPGQRGKTGQLYLHCM